MSLPDTVFIFVLALIIFGPKKLPEIGRQIGKLVGEFRRASNEFKYQIEEEMRQIDIQEKPARKSIASPAVDADASEAIEPPVLAEFPADPAADLPVGQHPNIDMLDTSELNHSDESKYYDFESESGESGMEYGKSRMEYGKSGMEYGESDTESGEFEIESGKSEPAAAAAEPAVPIIKPAEGSQPRTAAPFTQKIQVEEAPPAPAEHAHVETEISHG